MEVVISDVQMQGMSGLELCRLVKDQYDADVIIITGLVNNFAYEEIIGQGASDFIEKPIRLAEIVAESRGGDNQSGLAGGNVLLEGGAVVLNQSRVTANGFDNADGGNIAVVADPYLASTDSELTASSEFGVDGEVIIDAPITEVTGELSQLPQDFLDASTQLQEACLARNAPAGSFAVQRTRVAPPPDALFEPKPLLADAKGAAPTDDAAVCEDPDATP